MPDAPDLLVLSAHPMELVGFPEPRERFVRGRVSVATASVGVGIAAAGYGTARALGALGHPPRGVLLLGSCGSFAAWPTLTVVVGTEARLLDAAEVAGNAAHPPAMTTSALLDGDLRKGVASVMRDARHGVVGTTAGITTDDALAARLAQTGCDVENLEALAVAVACREAGAPLAVLLVVTNRVGAEGRGEWAAHHEQAAQVGADAVLAWLDAGAPGLPR